MEQIYRGEKSRKEQQFSGGISWNIPCTCSGAWDIYKKINMKILNST